MLRKTIRLTKSGSSISSAIHPLGLAHWNFRRDNGHSATRQRDLAITGPSFLPSFSSLHSFLQISVHALFLNPNTWKSRILHQLLAQDEHLRALNLSK
ncbi:hypothetical protein H5410_034997 [Solanum commersonii]|uniref:Uncharacterized protein n=1 Tax=Solanum commersonii TaxID=4109 RepID=A0A9J5Y0Q2_SOLCO|nr:hypothetical protein H5410_034997 [Solanum commersonii]